MLQLIFRFFYFLDRNNIDDYSYETAPYCGHHYSGHDGKWTESRYHEGDGGDSITTKLIVIWRSTERSWGFNTWILSYSNDFKSRLYWFLPLRRAIQKRFARLLRVLDVIRIVLTNTPVKRWHKAKWSKMISMVWNVNF